MEMRRNAYKKFEMKIPEAEKHVGDFRRRQQVKIKRNFTKAVSESIRLKCFRIRFKGGLLHILLANVEFLYQIYVL